MSPLVSLPMTIAVISSLLLKPSTACLENSTRLSDGRNEQEGRLEVCLDGVWGTVCNDPWSMANTNVACSELGLGDRGYYINTLPIGSGAILLAGIECSGEESSLMDCPRVDNGDPERICNHHEDTRIVCIPADTPPECEEEGQLRLVDGTSANNGRLEICLAGVWGTICNHMWDRNDAIVACRQLGINATGVFVEWHSQGSGPILLSGLSCEGSESNITECPRVSGALEDSCSHLSDVGILCSVLTEPECTNGDLRLVDGRTPNEGRVEVCQEGVWGSVCDKEWIQHFNGPTVCRQAGAIFDNTLFGTFGVVRGPIHLSAVFCFGSETSLFDCFSVNNHLENVFCYPSEPVGVICINSEDETIECVEPSLRLVDFSGVPSNDSGLVEVCTNGKWSRVCHNLWDRSEAETVCNELGYPSDGAIGYLVDDTSYIGPVASATCPQNNENGFYICLAEYNCLEQKHGFVICNVSDIEPACMDDDLRIENPEEFMTGSELTVGGRLEICYQGVWGTVCDDDWTISDAIVACTQLGHKTLGARFIREYYPPGTGPMILDDLHCTGAEKSLVDCTHSPFNQHNCRITETVGIYCNKLYIPTTIPPTTITPNTSTTATAPTTSMNGNTATQSYATTGGPESSPQFSPIILAVVVASVLAFLVLLVCFLAIATIATVAVRRRRKLKLAERRRLNLSHANPVYMQQMSTLSMDSPTALSNVYNMDVSAAAVSLRSHLALPTPSNVRGSFIRQITEDFIIPLKNLNLLTKIGEGEFGIVYKARLSFTGEVNEVVAVKTLKGMYSQEEVDAMLEEGLKLKHFQHPNVLGLIGVCVDAGPAPYIVMPYMSNGSLLSYLRQEKLALVLPDNVDEEIVADVTKRLITMCQQISKGMKYLAAEKFVHRDLAARNCMIDENCVIKIADFGLSEDIYSKTYFRQQASTNVKLPVKWMAMESLQEGIFSEKSDVWAYGVTCWEVFSGGKKPYPGVSPMGVVELLEGGERLTYPNNAACTEKMYAMMKSCWEQDPDRRPTFSEINEHLDHYLEELAGYIDIQFCLFPEIQRPSEVQLREKSHRLRKRSSSMDLKKEGLQIPTLEINGRAASMVSPWKSEQLL